MAIYKCKMCGGALEVEEGKTVVSCDYCGTQQTLPQVNDEVVNNLFNRANNLRLKSEFDKAHELYEKIINDGVKDSEAHWGMVLCKYGVEYVEDPSSYERVPTCHRTQVESVLTDIDYQSALELADPLQKSLYQQQAKAIDEIQKGILTIANKEEPFDVFICYKETDANGKRTRDSVIANDIYYQLKQSGFKVFYAAITLEDKIGREYEPYIFAALNSAKVMLVIGTQAEYFSAVWVKNEWSRFLKIMAKDKNRLLIPCYRDMEAYDLPEEFAHFQAQDMGKIGFIEDLTRGIKKVVKKEEKQKTVVVQESVALPQNIAPLLKRAKIFLEDADFKSANEYAEKVLDIEPECGEAYIVKLLVKTKCREESELGKLTVPFEEDSVYKKVIRYNAKDRVNALKEENLVVWDTFYERILNAFKKSIKIEQIEEGIRLVLSFYKFTTVHTELKTKWNIVSDLKNILEEELKRVTNAEIAQALYLLFEYFVGQEKSTHNGDDFLEELKEYEYKVACKQQEIEDFEGAIKHFIQLKMYKDSNDRLASCKTLHERMTIERLSALAQKEILQKNIIEAPSIYNQIIEKEPNEVLGYIGRSLCLLIKGGWGNYNNLFAGLADNTTLSNNYPERTKVLLSIDFDENLSILDSAAYWGNYKLVEYLIGLGADVNIRVKKGRTPLWWISHKPLKGENVEEKRKIAKLLLDNGAIINVRSPRGVDLYNYDTDKVIAKMIREKYPSAQKGESNGNREIAELCSGCAECCGCYVATCVYGSYDCPEVWTLRRYRDNQLAKSWYGRAFIRIYYAISPTLVKWFGKTKWFKKMWKGKLDRMVKKLQDKGVEDTPYKDKNWKV